MSTVGGLSIANNLLANNISLNLNRNEKSLTNLSTQLSSGLRINTSADDPSGYAVATVLQSQVDAYNQGSQNVQTANNLVAVANGALTTSTEIINRLNTLAVEASSDAISTQDRLDLQSEVQQLLLELDHISSATSFNGINLLDGSHAGFTTGQQSSATITSQAALNSNANANLATLNFLNTNTNSTDGTFEFQVVQGPTYAQTNVYYISTNVGGNPAVGAGTLIGTYLGTGVATISIANLSTIGALTILIATVATADVGLVSYAKILQFFTAVNVSATAPVLSFQDASNEGSVVQVALPNVSSSALRVNGVNVVASNNQFNSLASEDAIGQLQASLQNVLTAQAQLGAIATRLNYDYDSDNIVATNLQSSESSIRDLNIAQASTQYTKTNILVNLGTSLLSQANTNAQSVSSALQVSVYRYGDILSLTYSRSTRNKLTIRSRNRGADRLLYTVFTSLGCFGLACFPASAETLT